MKRLLTVIGARPQIIKSAALSRAVQVASDEVEECILHTGQHYDDNMSAVFFRELGLPAPRYNLGVGSGSHGSQTAAMVSGIEEVLLREHFDGVVLYGDTNSTLAGAVAAAKLQVPVFHVEAGLRSYNMAMPEEQNRIVCDHLASICFAPTATAVENLRREGLLDSPSLFSGGRGRKTVNSGDVMYDNSLHFSALAAERCDIIRRLGLQPDGYVLATVHRDYNTDCQEHLESIFRALLDIATETSVRVVVPLHPRTLQRLDTRFANHESPFLTLIPPVSFLEMLELERNARLVMTDSGGVQKEAFFFERPCVILRTETEWVELVEHGAGIVAGADYRSIRDAYDRLAHRRVTFPPLFGDGHAAEHILTEIRDYLA